MVHLAAGPFLLGVGPGCASKTSPACPQTCNADEPAIIELCGSSNVTGVSLSGACSLLDAGYADGSPVLGGRWIFVTSPAPGDCDITLTYTTGMTSSLAVTFASQAPPEPAGCPACPAYTAPDQSAFSVGSCLAGGKDAQTDGVGD